MKAYDRAQPPGLRCSFTAHIFNFIFAIVLCIASWPASGGEHRRRIYFLESLAPTQLAAIRTIDAFQKRMSEKTSESFDIFIDYMELERFPSQAHIDSTVGYLSQKYSEAPPDVLIPLGRAAIPFMVKYRDIIAPGVPTIIANVPARAVADGKALDNTVWVASEYNFAKTLELAQRLQPTARNLAIVAGSSRTICRGSTMPFATWNRIWIAIRSSPSSACLTMKL